MLKSPPIYTIYVQLKTTFLYRASNRSSFKYSEIKDAWYNLINFCYLNGIEFPIDCQEVFVRVVVNDLNEVEE